MGTICFSTTRLLNTQKETLLVSIAKAEIITSGGQKKIKKEKKKPTTNTHTHKWHQKNLVGTLSLPDVQNQYTIQEKKRV